MVGVPRSGACSLCRKRRVKCDEGRPGCGNCRKYGADCPGYERVLKFVDGKHQIRQKGKRSDRSSTESSTVSGDSSNLIVSRKSTSLVTPLARALLPIRGQIMEVMIDNFRPADTPHDIVGLFTWITPEHLGKKAILDGSICSLALHLTGKEKNDPQLVAQSRTLYGQCLNELQTTLQHPSEWKSSETLCSTILLCYYELFAGTSSPDTWLQHCKGIGSLMKHRGPAAHANGWEAAMLLYFRGILIMSDMFYPDENPCFLSQPAWKQVMRDDGRHLIHPDSVPSDIIRVVDGFFQHLAEVPEVLKWGYRLREANKAGIPVDAVKAFMLAQHTAQVHANFTIWVDEEFSHITTPAVEVPSSSPGTSLYPTILEYEHPWAGSMYLGSWASIIILQEVLTQCGWPVDYEASQRDLVQKILRSVESVGKGIMGPYRVGYSLRIAYEFASAEAQVWIRGLLDGFSKSYAALDKSMYPTPRADQNGYA